MSASGPRPAGPREQSPDEASCDPKPDAKRAAISRRVMRRALAYGEAWALVGLTLMLCVFFSVLPATADVFPTSANFQAIAGSQAVLAIAALAVLIPLVANQFDLSVGANLNLCAVMSASLMASGIPLVIAAMLGIAVGTGVGVVNGLLVTRAQVNGVVVTLGTTLLLEGAVAAKTKGLSITEGISPHLINFASGTTLAVPRILLVAVALAGAVYYLLQHTPFGRHLYMLGENLQAARLVGLRNNWLTFTTFAISGGLAGIGGVLLIGQLGSADPRTGASLTLPALAAAFLSAAAIRPGRFNVWGAMTAISLLAILNGGLNLVGAATYMASLVNGAALIAGVSLAAFLGRRRDAASA